MVSLCRNIPIPFSFFYKDPISYFKSESVRFNISTKVVCNSSLVSKHFIEVLSSAEKCIGPSEPHLNCHAPWELTALGTELIFTLLYDYGSGHNDDINDFKITIGPP